MTRNIKLFLTISFGISLGFGSVGIAKADTFNTVLKDVTTCDKGTMTFDNAGWLKDGELKIDYHQLVAVSPSNAMPDELWAKMLSGTKIAVCKEGKALTYTAVKARFIVKR